MRSLRIRSRETRLAVMFATAPESKVRRALAMSTNGVSTGTPTACTDDDLPPTSVSTRSMSWIMRSSTTATSAPRGLNGASRSLWMKRGASTKGSAARMARLNRSTCPVCTSAPCRPARASIASASSSVTAMGFSISAWMPRASTCCATAKCDGVGTTIVTASTTSSSASSESKARTPSSSATCAARSGRDSWKPAKSGPCRSRRIRMWWCPSPPAPMTPVRTRVLTPPLRARSPRRSAAARAPRDTA